MSSEWFPAVHGPWRFRSGRSQFVQCAALLIILTGILQNERVRAADFTFDPIPVKVDGLKNLAGHQIWVRCGVLDNAKHFLGNMWPSIPLPHPREGTLDASGSFAGTLADAIDLMNPNDAPKAVSYKCSLVGRLGGSSRDLEIGDGSQWWHVKSGNLSVEGPIP